MNSHRRLALGLSLVELMVALAIGGFLIAGAVTVYVRSRATYAVNETVARLQENARYALSTIEPDVRLANYWGLMNDAALLTGTAGNAPIPLSGVLDDCGAGFAIDLAHPIDGTNNGYDLDCTAGPDPGNGPSPGADTVVVRRAEEPTSPANVRVLQVYTTRQGGSSQVFNGDTAPGLAAALVADPVFGPRAEVHNLVVRAYYVSQSSSQGLDVPSLRRKNLVRGDLPGGPEFRDEEILPGIEDLQVQFGIDLGADDNGDGIIDDKDGNGMPDRYTGVASRYVNPGDAALDDAQIVAVRLWIRVRADSPEPGYTDTRPYRYADVNYTPAGAERAFRRLLVSRTIQIRNTVNLQT